MPNFYLYKNYFYPRRNFDNVYFKNYYLALKISLNYGDDIG